jgi:hypothetical protein
VRTEIGPLYGLSGLQYVGPRLSNALTTNQRPIAQAKAPPQKIFESLRACILGLFYASNSSRFHTWSAIPASIAGVTRNDL